MRQPIKIGERYEDCTYKIATAREVCPVLVNWKQVLWYWFTRRARHWDVLGEYDSPLITGDISNASWVNCGCVRVD